MEKNSDYTITRSVLFDNGRGFALGESPKAPAPFVTWQFTQEQGKRDYYWGHYHSDEQTAVSDYNNRVFDYEQQYGVERVDTQGPDFYKYYSTQRPVGIGTFPRTKANLPVGILNYGERRPVEDGAFLAWGELLYLHPLTEKEQQDYELRAAPDNLDVRQRPQPIAEQMKAAEKLAGEHRGQPVPKKDAPDRGDR